MGRRGEIAAAIRGVIETSWPDRLAGTELRDDLPIGEGGLGLDSVEIVELLFACEDQYGFRARDDLFNVVPLTIDQLAEHYARVAV